MYQQQLQSMFSSSLAVLQHPSVATFEEHERNDLQAATIYVAVAAIIAGVLAAIGAAIKQTPGFGLGGALIGGLIGTLVGFFIYLGVVYLLGRAFGGTGNFGELAFDISLFHAPLLVVFNLLNMVAIGPLGILTALAALVVSIYQIYLTYFGIQSGMNLPKDKAIWVMVILFLIAVAIAACIALFVAAIFVAVFRSANP